MRYRTDAIRRLRWLQRSVLLIMGSAATSCASASTTATDAESSEVSSSPQALRSNVGPGAASSGDTSAVVGVAGDGHLFYDYWNHGQQPQGFRPLPGDGVTDVSPAVSLVGDQHDYLFVAIKDLSGHLMLNKGIWVQHSQAGRI